MIVEIVDREGRTSSSLETVFFLKKRSIFLTGEISDKLSTEIIQQIMYLASLNKEPIRLYINSPGGSVSDGLAIYDVMKACGCTVITICTGLAASMAAVLLAAGTPGHRYCSTNAEVMIHQVMGQTQGQATDIELCAAHIRRVKEKINRLLSKMTGKSITQICLDTDRDNYMDAGQALKYGIVDHVGTLIV